MTPNSLTVFTAACIASLSFAQADDWRYGLPDTGLTPSSFSYEGVVRADARDGQSAFGVQSIGISVPLSDPRKSGYQKWIFSAELDMNLSAVSSYGGFNLSEDYFYSLDLPIALIRSYESGNRLTMAILPSLACDMGHTDGGFTMGAMAQYRIAVNENFSYSLGLAYSPRYVKFGFLPLVGFEWKINEQWSLEMEKMSLALNYSSSENLKYGPFIGYSSNSWTAHTEQGARWLSYSSLVCGIQSEILLPSSPGNKHIINVAVGMSIFTRAETRFRNWDRDRDFRRYYEPALYLSAGIDLRF